MKVKKAEWSTKDKLTIWKKMEVGQKREERWIEKRRELIRKQKKVGQKREENWKKRQESGA